MNLVQGLLLLQHFPDELIKGDIMKTLFTALILLIATAAQAETLNFAWTANTDTTEGYRMFMDTSSNIVADNIPVATDTYTLDMVSDGQCHNFWLRAYRGNLESGNSDVAVWCPAAPTDPPLPNQPPVNVGGFTINIVVTPN